MKFVILALAATAAVYAGPIAGKSSYVIREAVSQNMFSKTEEFPDYCIRQCGRSCMAPPAFCGSW